MREDSGVENSLNSGFKPTSETPERRRRLNEDVVAFIGIICISESGSYGGNSSKFEEREFLGTIADNLVFDLAKGLKLDFRVRGSETTEYIGLAITGRGGSGGGGRGGSGGRHGGDLVSPGSGEIGKRLIDLSSSLLDWKRMAESFVKVSTFFCFSHF